MSCLHNDRKSHMIMGPPDPHTSCCDPEGERLPDCCVHCSTHSRARARARARARGRACGHAQSHSQANIGLTHVSVLR